MQHGCRSDAARFSALQRAEIAEMLHDVVDLEPFDRFSALQRAEIAEIHHHEQNFRNKERSFSALQRAEIAEIPKDYKDAPLTYKFQCSSTSRNC